MSEPKPLVILLCYHFPPSPAIGAARPYRFYTYLKSAGYECRVVTASRQCSPAPPDVVVVAGEFAHVWEGRAELPRNLRGWSELVLRKYLFPGAEGLSWAMDAGTACWRIAREAGPPAVLLSSYPPDGVLFAAMIAARRRRMTWIADFRDPIFSVPERVYNRSRRLVRRRMESLALSWSSAVIANTRQMAERWRKMLGPRGRAVHVIWNGFDANDRPVAAPLPAGDRIQLAHVGSLYAGRNPNLLLASVNRLRRKGSAKALQTQILLVGDVGALAGIDEDLAACASREGWLEMTGTVAKSEAQAIIASAHGQVLLQPATAVQVPGKLFEYICIGRPILAVTPRASETEYLLRNCGIPYVCLHEDDPEDATDENLLRFLDLPPDPVPFSSWFEENFEMRKQGAQLTAVIDSVARARP